LRPRARNRMLSSWHCSSWSGRGITLWYSVCLPGCLEKSKSR
jgi:hypothetical protein